MAGEDQTEHYSEAGSDFGRKALRMYAACALRKGVALVSRPRLTRTGISFEATSNKKVFAGGFGAKGIKMFGAWWVRQGLRFGFSSWLTEDAISCGANSNEEVFGGCS